LLIRADLFIMEDITQGVQLRRNEHGAMVVCPVFDDLIC
jgi:hypothetical protein